MKFHNELNPKLWDKNNEEYTLKEEVKTKLEEIATAFIEYLDIPANSILDKVITGSSASYNYTEFSDLDLHIIVDFDKVHKDCPVVEGYLSAMKSTFNKEHDIFIHGIPVELYAEKKDQGTVHNGLYSLQTGWIDIPNKIEPTDNDAAVEAKYNELKELIDKCETAEVADEILDKIYTMRKAGLVDVGEFSTENLAFKKLRNEGIMNKLRQLKKQEVDKQLSLESYNEPIVNESWNTYSVQYQVIDRNDRISTKTKEFKTEKALQNWIAKQEDNPNFYGILATSYPDEIKLKEDNEDDGEDISEEMHKERYVTYFETQEGRQKYTIYHVYTDSTDDSYNELCDKRDNQLGMYNSYKELKDALKERAEKIAAKQGWTVKSIENLGEDDEYYRKRNKNESIKEGFNKGDKVQLKRKNNKIGIVKSIFNGDKDKNNKDIKYLDVEFEDGTKEGRPASDFKKIDESIKEDYEWHGPIAKVTFDNGDVIETEINGTDEEIKSYYMGKTFNLGREEDDMHKVVKVEVIRESMEDVRSNFKTMAKRIVSDFKAEGYPKSNKFYMDFAKEAVEQFKKDCGCDVKIATGNGELILTLENTYQAIINARTNKVKFSDWENSNYMFENKIMGEIKMGHKNESVLNEEKKVLVDTDYGISVTMLVNEPDEEHKFVIVDQDDDAFCWGNSEQAVIDAFIDFMIRQEDHTDAIADMMVNEDNIKDERIKEAFKAYLEQKDLDEDCATLEKKMDSVQDDLNKMIKDLSYVDEDKILESLKNSIKEALN